MDFSGETDNTSGSNENVSKKPVKEDKQRHVIAKERTVQQIIEDENIKISIAPKLIFGALIIVTLFATLISIIAFATENGNNYLYFITAIIYTVDSIVLVVK